MFTYSFERLEVWQDSKELLKEIYSLCSNYPKDEKYALVSQMKRAALSVVSNIAEGSSRKSNKDQAHFYQIAYSSTIELLAQLIVSNEMNIIDEDEYKKCRDKVEKVTNKINALRRSRLND